MNRFILCVLMSSLFLDYSHGKSALDKMFQSLASDVNISTPGSFHDQASGYYTGGGFMMRNKHQTIQPIQVSLPHFGAGCRGIDAYMGAISFVNGKQMIELLRNMGKGAATYAFQLSLKTMAPQIENLFAQLRKLALDANALMMEDCRMVQSLYAAALPKGSAFQEQACIDVRKQGNHDTDWFGARQKCTTDEEINAGIQNLKSKSQDLMVGEYNLVWHVLQKSKDISEDLKFFIMSTVGTVISRKDENQQNKYRVHTFEGKADDQGFLTAYLKGGQTEILSCDTKDKCLNPTWQKQIIAPEEAMVQKVLSKILSIRHKYLNKGQLTSEEIGFLNDTVNVPVYRYIQVSAAAGTQFIMQDAVEYIAASVILTQFEKIASEVMASVETLRNIQMEDSEIKKFKQNLQMLRSRLHVLLSNANQSAIWRLTKQIQGTEKAQIAQKEH